MPTAFIVPILGAAAITAQATQPTGWSISDTIMLVYVCVSVLKDLAVSVISAWKGNPQVKVAQNTAEQAQQSVTQLAQNSLPPQVAANLINLSSKLQPLLGLLQQIQAPQQAAPPAVSATQVNVNTQPVAPAPAAVRRPVAAPPKPVDSGPTVTE